ncbi:MsnO8 family LLM class oxidoreductase [Kutzneria sp. 744]|uniref:MsnO8 family LLM class oxidoreductase n=1 Tax=Kutzneria sp. (strain 744) TaxID=345341 RepID=UPI0003EEE1D7|nr:MsnO8 family LLM class oxidoreductase [Kutzneria sp. 744]EWM17949.1 luciferase [Kutzneria sp. 744]
MIPLSVLDLSPIVSGGSAAEALRNSVDLARRAEELGYHRYWVAQHHLTPGVAAAAPSVLATVIAEATSRIRVGSAAVLLGYVSPVVAAEQFGTLAHLHPDRVDLGLGRSGTTKLAEVVGKVPDAQLTVWEQLNRILIPMDAGPYLNQVRSILEFLDGTGEHHAVAAEHARLQVWIHGATPGESARAAGALGLPFGVAYHFAPETAFDTIAAYRAAFVPSTRLAEPYVAVSADIVVAETTSAARELASGYGQWVLGVRSSTGAPPYPSPAEVAAFPWTERQRASVADRVGSQFVGAPEEVAADLEELRAKAGADEVVVTTITHDHAARVRSYELLAKAWGTPG